MKIDFSKDEVENLIDSICYMIDRDDSDENRAIMSPIHLKLTNAIENAKPLKIAKNANGTSLVGYISATYDDLVKTFGEPHGGGSTDGKVQCEWAFQLPKGGVFTIYDYKSDLAPSANMMWHIGGNKPFEVIKPILALAGFQMTTA